MRLGLLLNSGGFHADLGRFSRLVLVAAFLCFTSASGQPTAGLELQTRQMSIDLSGKQTWIAPTQCVDLVPSQTALLICDMWDRHWSRGATQRVAELAPLVDRLARVLRSKGVVIIHSPSETEAFYANSQALKRSRTTVRKHPPSIQKIDLPALPIDDSDGGSDTGETPWYQAWTRQHPAIYIDDNNDFISADGEEVYSIAQARGIRTIFYCGVHTNMCVLRRSFALKSMAERGLQVVLVRDLTDAMYNPARSPYVTHEEGTRLVVEYIEKFLCPTVLSTRLMRIGEPQ